MARIRTIKPSFFRHEVLFEAEQQTGLPLRLAFVGLWTAADREGRFRWAPRVLKLDCLPYDDTDFSRVLDALATRGLIVRYEVDGIEYGYIPSWQKHQVINNREMASDLPEPNETNTFTREPRVDDAPATPLVQTQGEGNMEGKGKEQYIVAKAPNGNSDFEKLKRAYPKRAGNYGWKAAEKKFNSLVKTGVDPQAIISAASRLCQTLRSKIGTEFIPMPASWLNSEDFAEIAADAFESDVPLKGYYAAFDSPQLDAWDKHSRALTGKLLPRDRNGGWRVDCEWPPGYQPPGVSFETAPAALRPMQ